MKINKKTINTIIMISIIALIDQLVKWIILKRINNSSIIVINNILNLTYVENTGCAFGIGNSSVILFIIISIIIIGVLISYLISRLKQLNNISIISLSLIIAGGIGNIIDRIFRGYVIDYIDISPIIKYPVFNFADICIVLGVIVLIISLVTDKNKV